MIKTCVLLSLFSFGVFTNAQCYDSLPSPKRINIVISNKAPSPDPALMSFHLQAWWNQLFHRKWLHFIIATTLDEAVNRVTHLMKKEHAMIGNIWFDSHGYMGRRVTILEIGDAEINYKSIQDPLIREKIMAIGNYCDSATKVTLGSCYSGAGYYSAGNDSFPPQRMNGDVLMSQFAEMMNQATIFGSVSWITTKPGIFNAGYASAGNPWAKRFKDPKFRPAWDSLGVWKSYSASEGFAIVNTVTMDHRGNIRILEKTFLDIPRHKKKQQKIIRRLKVGNFSDEYFYKYKDPLHVYKGRK